MENLERLKIAEDAVRLGMNILNASGHEIQVNAKGIGDIVTDYDFEIEDIIREHIRKHDAHSPIQGEEKGGHDGSKGGFWVIDPIDGTVNFSRNLPHFAISVAYIENEQPVVAAIGFPATQSVFSAESGKGAFENGTRLKVSETTQLSDSVVGFGDFSCGRNREIANQLRFSVFSTVVNAILRIRMHGSAAYDLCMVAKGSLDASVTLSNTAWDVSAGVLMVRESGGSVQDGDGSHHTVNSKYTMATNGRLSGELQRLIRRDIGM